MQLKIQHVMQVTEEQVDNVIELLEKQKELTKDYKNSNTDLKLKDKVALTIKDIAKTIEIFLNKKPMTEPNTVAPPTPSAVSRTISIFYTSSCV